MGRGRGRGRGGAPGGQVQCCCGGGSKEWGAACSPAPQEARLACAKRRWEEQVEKNKREGSGSVAGPAQPRMCRGAPQAAKNNERRAGGVSGAVVESECCRDRGRWQQSTRKNGHAVGVCAAAKRGGVAGAAGHAGAGARINRCEPGPFSAKTTWRRAGPRLWAYQFRSAAGAVLGWSCRGGGAAAGGGELHRVH